MSGRAGEGGSGGTGGNTLRKLLIASLLGLGAALGCGSGEDRRNEEGAPAEPAAEVRDQDLPALQDLDFGGDFVLTDTSGKAFDTRSLRGKAVLLFFGYTSCPDACPMTLSKIARVHALLGEAAGRVQAVYVTVDPERDTPEKMGAYLSYYSVPVVGLSGTPAEVDSVAGDFGVYYRKSEETTAAGYLVDHSTIIYLVDPRGRLRFLFRNDHTPDVMAALVRKAAEG